MILQAVETIVSIFLMIAAGLFIAWRKWITPEGAKAVPRIIINIAVPAMIVYFFSADISRTMIFSSWLPLLIVFIVVPVTFFIGKLAAVVFRVPKERRGVFNALFSFSNSVFIGFPVAYALFGDAGMPFAVFYYFANTTYFWTLGYYGIRKDADRLAGKKTKITPGEVLKKLLIPPIITILIMFALVFLDIRLPGFVLQTAKHLSALTTPMSLIFMGSMIFWAGKEGVAYERDLTPVIIGRFLIAPAVCFLACSAAMTLFNGKFAALDMYLMRSVFTVQTGLPVMTTTAILADLYGAGSRYATRSYFWTTLLSLVTIPAFMLVFHFLRLSTV